MDNRIEKKAKELYARVADLGYSKAHNLLADVNNQWGDMNKTKLHFEAAAMAGHEVARFNLVESWEGKSGNFERAMKNVRIAGISSALCCHASIDYIL
jgi:hypothetical protein